MSAATHKYSRVRPSQLQSPTNTLANNEKGAVTTTFQKNNDVQSKATATTIYIWDSATKSTIRWERLEFKRRQKGCSGIYHWYRMEKQNPVHQWTQRGRGFSYTQVGNRVRLQTEKRIVVLHWEQNWSQIWIRIPWFCWTVVSRIWKWNVGVRRKWSNATTLCEHQRHEDKRIRKKIVVT